MAENNKKQHTLVLFNGILYRTFVTDQFIEYYPLPCAQVDFTVSLNISTSEGECLKEKKQFFLKLQGISETLKVSVETLCDCDCQDREEQSSHCNENGTLTCGICRQVLKL